MIPESVLNQIQDRTDIVEVIASVVALKRAGRNFKAPCPFHHEKTPSFIVNPDKQIFHCFGCGVGGNVFSFLMKFEKKDFREAVESLADRAGIELPKDKEENSAALQRTALYLKANQLALEYFRKSLLTQKEAEKARVYLKARGLTQETQESFKLGFAPESWDGLYKALKAEVPDAVMEKTGLVIAKKEDGFYDRFRNRVIFPILDAKGACVAFGGRVLDDALPKYLNSPETEIYSKGRNLYGLFQARRSIRENDWVVVVEGYMDLIACHQAGVTNVVASLGTALTPEQARLIKRNTLNAVMLYDADKAGEMATLRGLEIFLEEGVEVKIVRLPQGHDPDSFIKEQGAESFREELSRAKSLFEYKLALLKQRFDAKTLEGKVKIANEMVQLFSKLRNEISKAAWTKELAKDLALSENAILAEMNKGARVPRPGQREAGLPAGMAMPAGVKIDVTPLEKLVLGLMLEGPEFVAMVKEGISEREFQHPVIRAVVSRMFETVDASASQLVSLFKDDADAARLIALACAQTENTADKKKTLADCLVRMKRLRIRGEREGLMTKITEAERDGDKNRINKFMSELNELNKREKQINEKK